MVNFQPEEKSKVYQVIIYCFAPVLSLVVLFWFVLNFVFVFVFVGLFFLSFGFLWWLEEGVLFRRKCILKHKHSICIYLKTEVFFKIKKDKLISYGMNISIKSYIPESVKIYTFCRVWWREVWSWMYWVLWQLPPDWNRGDWIWEMPPCWRFL